MQPEVQSNDLFVKVGRTWILKDQETEDWIHAEWELFQSRVNATRFVVFAVLFFKIKIFSRRRKSISN
jgi:hypothetical protein